MTDSINARIKRYENVATHNEELFKEFVQLTDSISWLKNHRDTIEAQRWGTGERAFHYMWWLLLSDVSQSNSHPSCLEIGVFKGQIISLWAEVGKHLGVEISISGISPLEGNSSEVSSSGLTSRLLKRARCLVDNSYRQAALVGNLYPRENYKETIRQVFERFELDIGRVRLIKGYSNDPEVMKSVQDDNFDIIYIDGDHSFEGSSSDIAIYAPFVKESGFLIMDDAAQFVPGEGYFKGYESVSLACEKLPEMGFVNILNVGHNRVYKRITKP